MSALAIAAAWMLVALPEPPLLARSGGSAKGRLRGSATLDEYRADFGVGEPPISSSRGLSA